MKYILGVLCLTLCLWHMVSGDEKLKDVGTVIGIDLGTTYSWWVENSLHLYFLLYFVFYMCHGKMTVEHKHRKADVSISTWNFIVVTIGFLPLIM